MLIKEKSFFFSVFSLLVSSSKKDRADLIRLLIKHGAQVNHLDRSSMAAIS